MSTAIPALGRRQLACTLPVVGAVVIIGCVMEKIILQPFRILQHTPKVGILPHLLPPRVRVSVLLWWLACFIIIIVF
jgi:hypothetical protein